MKFYVFLFTSTLLINPVFSQETTDSAFKKGKIHTIHVQRVDGSVQKGYLYQVNENGLTIATTPKDLTSLYSLSPEQINNLQIRRKGSVGKGALIGGVAGAGIGVLIGYLSGDDKDEPDIWYDYSNTAGEKAAIGGFTGLLGGAGIGMIIGALTKKKFIIQGKKENYQLHYQHLVEKAMVRR